VSYLFEVIDHLREKGCAVTILATRRPIEGSPGDWVAAARYVPTDGGAKRWAVVQRVGPVVSSTLDLDVDTAAMTAIAIARREGGPGDRTRTGGPDA
jgi:hypothetical protein